MVRRRTSHAGLIIEPLHEAESHGVSSVQAGAGEPNRDRVPLADVVRERPKKVLLAMRMPVAENANLYISHRLRARLRYRAAATDARRGPNRPHHRRRLAFRHPALRGALRTPRRAPTRVPLWGSVLGCFRLPVLLAPGHQGPLS
jgi:hypothetical protein